MTEQMTTTGVLVLCGAIVLFWGVVGTLIRLHRSRGSRTTEPTQ